MCICSFLSFYYLTQRSIAYRRLAYGTTTYRNPSIAILSAMDGTEDELLYGSEDDNESEVDSSDSDWDPYYNETIIDDLYDELFHRMTILAILTNLKCTKHIQFVFGSFITYIAFIKMLS